MKCEIAKEMAEQVAKGDMHVACECGDVVIDGGWDSEKFGENDEAGIDALINSLLDSECCEEVKA